MKTLNINKLLPIGFLKKTHGVKGELLLQFDRDDADEFAAGDFLFFVLEGLPVPFCIEDYTVRSDDLALVRFKYIETKEDAQKHLGVTVAIEKELKLKDVDDFDYSVLIGYRVLNQSEQFLGIITMVENFSGNVVLSVKSEQRELMIPINNELVLDFNQDKKELLVEIADGLID